MKRLLKNFVLLLAIVLSSFALKENGYKAGDKASDFVLKNTDGKLVSLKDIPNAKGFILVFTCNHCPCAAKYEDRILALDKKYRPLGYPVVAVNSLDLVQYPTESLNRMKMRASKKNILFIISKTKIRQ